MSNQIEQIRAEIERRRKAQLDKNGNAKSLFCAVRLWAYADLLGLLDIIQEHPVPAEEDEKGFCKDNCKGFQDTGGRCFADGDCKAKQEADLKASIAPEADLEAEIDREIQKLHTAPCYDELRNFARHFYAVGMHAERERMMKEAPVAEVREMRGSTETGDPFILTLAFRRIPNIEYHGGKVRVIIEEIKD